MSVHIATHRPDSLPGSGELVREILKAAQSIRDGQVQIIIQDPHVVQIDQTERLGLA